MQKKKGISLIVLVITIIVMIVLAGAIILSLNNAGIIGKANQAVKSTDLATVKELAQMAWAEAYADGVRSVEDTYVNDKKVEGLKTKVKIALEANDVNKEGNIQYLIGVTEKGVTVKPIEEGWVLDKEELKVKRGEEELTIGQSVNYKSSVEGYTDEEGWQVLGADEEGNLLIISSKNVASSYKVGSKDLEAAQKELLNLVDRLDGECKKYGNGEYAKEARSIRVEDIDKVTRYDKNTYGKDKIYQYGNVVTYKYNASIYPYYEGSNGQKNKLIDPHSENTFYWYNEDGFGSVTDLENQERSGEKIVTLTSTYYGYAGTNNGKLAPDTDAYKMLFGTSDNLKHYWLASTYISTDTEYVRYGIRNIRNGDVGRSGLWSSKGEGYSAGSAGVRAVVALQYNIPYVSLVPQQQSTEI